MTDKAQRVSNRASGFIRTLIQNGTLNGDVHLHAQQRSGTAVLAAVWFPALVAVCSLLPSAEALTPPDSTAPLMFNYGPEPQRPPAVSRRFTAQVAGEPVFALSGVRVAPLAAEHIPSSHLPINRCYPATAHNDELCKVLIKDAVGTRGGGSADFNILTHDMTCKATGVSADYPAVLDLGSSWVEIRVLAVDPPADGLPSRVSFEISRYFGSPVPRDANFCFPSWEDDPNRAQLGLSG